MFDFVREGGEWHLVNDLIVRSAAAVENSKQIYRAAPVSATAKNPGAPKALQHHSLATVKRRASVSVCVNYDRTAAVNYARTYTLSYRGTFLWL